VAEQDYDRLAQLAEGSDGPGARLLGQELDRAIVVEPKRFRRPFVRLYSTVTFYDPSTGQARRLTLTPPDEADIDRGRLSVTAPVGAALIGLSVGDVFSWRADNGRPREVAVVRIAAADDPEG
jgi:regulator of nucleoside diphosphate kinase